MLFDVSRRIEVKNSISRKTWKLRKVIYYTQEFYFFIGNIILIKILFYSFTFRER